MNWEKHFDDRQKKEIRFCRLYSSSEFSHGTDGHNAKMIVAKMSEVLSIVEKIVLSDNTAGQKLRKIETILRISEDTQQSE